ncbi:hypothetical protein ACE1CI_03370 [Aerosakkonemataceae cyanobacterium BLCC-F50]|uniref:Uncharacterized protein n=1 Tax=Floridaenema flaviceps BLCC-F50 TaxID=3153642 RepID=A0ABV4XJU4_9CYAN
METINFAGIEGKVIQSSPHGNYVVVTLSDRITIVGTFNNAFNWQESEDQSSGFLSFITYIGLRSPSEINKFKPWLINHNGYFNRDEDVPRKSKRVQKFPLEIKVRGLSAESVVELIQLK